ncbi:LysE family translocator [Desulforamulus ruminis]|uniref:LysE family translocator n=1 Tax=Desulforamulus ruminis TaxID=1564 RepID=UPI0023524F47|nr:LysE family transporter [Desulforamulus ruminis]
MDIGFFLKGLIIGFSIAAPVGPIGILCIKRSLSKGRMQGFISGLGAASADALYGCIAGFGLTAITNLFLSQKLLLNMLGGLFLCYLGCRTFFSMATAREVPLIKNSYLGSYLSVFLLTLTNPMTIFSFLGIFSGLGVVESSSYRSAITLVLGVFWGSALWWFILSNLANGFRQYLNQRGMNWINRGSGLVLFIFGIMALWNIKG